MRRPVSMLELHDIAEIRTEDTPDYESDGFAHNIVSELEAPEETKSEEGMIMGNDWEVESIFFSYAYGDENINLSNQGRTQNTAATAPLIFGYANSQSPSFIPRETQSQSTLIKNMDRSNRNDLGKNQSCYTVPLGKGVDNEECHIGSSISTSDHQEEKKEEFHLRRSMSCNALPSVASRPSLKSSSSQMKLRRANVSFTNLEVREYSIALGDHPDCSRGPPVTLGWDYVERGVVDVDEYEAQRGVRPRSKRSFKLNHNERTELLETKGYSKKELKNSIKEVNKVRAQRDMTDLLSVTGRLEEALESAGRKVKRFMAKKKKSMYA